MYDMPIYCLSQFLVQQKIHDVYLVIVYFSESRRSFVCMNAKRQYVRIDDFTKAHKMQNKPIAKVLT